MKNPLYLLASLLFVTVACGNGGNPADPPELLFVQTSDGAVLTDSTLTLTGVSPQTGWFSDRPYRQAGQISTAGFVSLWGEGEDSFADDLPNADFTCTVDGEVVNYVLELSAPVLDGNDLIYAVWPVGETSLPAELECEGDSHVFVDNMNLADCGADGSASGILYATQDTECDLGALRA